MPIYEYRCEECQQLFEEWCKHVEDESVLHNCPICKGAAKRIMSHNSFALKGGGWYVTEYGSRNKDHGKSGAAQCGSGGCAGESKGCGQAAATGAPGCSSGGVSGGVSGGASGSVSGGTSPGAS